MLFCPGHHAHEKDAVVCRRDNNEVIALALDSFAARAVEAEREGCIAAIRAACGPCLGTGHADGVEEAECEYCGRPIAAIRARGAK